MKRFGATDETSCPGVRSSQVPDERPPKFAGMRWVSRLRVFAVALVLASSVAGVTATTSAATCSRTPTAGLEPRLAGEGRYLLSVPAGIRDRAPLLLALHGNPSTAEQEQSGWQWEDIARGFIVAYPSRDVHTASDDTVSLFWDWTRGSRDVAFLRTVIQDITGRYCVDGARIHVTGTSGGAYMAQRMACDAADVIASIGEYAGGAPESGARPGTRTPGGKCTPTRPVSVIMFHGTADANVPVGSGRASRTLWGERLGCAGVTTRRYVDGSSTTLAPCRAGTEVVWREYTGEDHFTASMRHGDEIRRMQLAFFARHRMP